MSAKLRHTPGPVEVKEVMGQKFVAAKPYEGHPYFNRTTTIEILSDEDYPTRNGDIELIAEVFNVTTESGLTPRQLLEQRDALLEAGKNLVASIDRCVASRDIAGGSILANLSKNLSAAIQSVEQATNLD